MKSILLSNENRIRSIFNGIYLHGSLVKAKSWKSCSQDVRDKADKAWTNLNLVMNKPVNTFSTSY